MIVVKIQGGLGNQMFCYALSYALAKEKEWDVKTDITDFETYDVHTYQLDKLNITDNVASANELAAFRLKGVRKLINKIQKKFLAYYRQFVVDEQQTGFDSNIFKVRNGAYLKGYWQSENYFKTYRDDILRLFAVKAPLAGKNLETAKKIENTEAVSLHIRRGDYVSNESASKKHGVCGLDYYQKAIDYIAARCTNPTFFIFSDDLEWVKQNLEMAFPVVYVDNNDGNTGYEDMRLMSLSRHNIIANSTFSWWGAWLNPRRDKMVIAPQQWFADSKKNKDADSIIPAEWIRL